MDACSLSGQNGFMLGASERLQKHLSCACFCSMRVSTTCTCVYVPALASGIRCPDGESELPNRTTSARPPRCLRTTCIMHANGIVLCIAMSREALLNTQLHQASLRLLPHLYSSSALRSHMRPCFHWPPSARMPLPRMLGGFHPHDHAAKRHAPAGIPKHCTAPTCIFGPCHHGPGVLLWCSALWPGSDSPTGSWHRIGCSEAYLH